MTSFNSLGDDWMGVERLGATNRLPYPPQNVTKTPDSLPPDSGAASHPFSLEPLQPLTPMGHFIATAISPTLTWNNGKTIEQHGQDKLIPQSSPRVNLDGACASSSSSLPRLSPRKREPNSGNQAEE
eukprot:16448990-Heterocapsa_arctica.AAC.1